MTTDTITKLNNLTTDFYRTVADSFDQTRTAAWEGWFLLKPYLEQQPIKKQIITDLGCGNGRFAKFLDEHISNSVAEYHGFDTDKKLLSLAQESRYTVATTFHELDLVSQLLQAKLTVPRESSTVTAFGVLHHVPSQQLRRSFFSQLAKLVAADTLLILTAWQFADHARYRSKLLAPPSNISPAELEENDFFLGWKETPAVRYCHHTTAAELQELIDAAEWQTLTTFSADGKSHDLNLYLVLQRTAQ